MEQHQVQDSHAEWLGDIEYRQEFGSETAKLAVAAALADAREAAGMTQSALAERARVSQAYIAKLERGDANPTIGHIGRLLACMWLKPSVGFTPMPSPTSFESVQVESESDPEFDLVYSDDLSSELPDSQVEQPSPAMWTSDGG